MTELILSIRNNISKTLYKYLLKPILFKFDPEDVHDFFTKIGEILGKHSFTRIFTKMVYSYQNPILEQKILGIKFKNPIGLSAGFDKDARLTEILPSVGFGFMEIGSITAKPYEGNKKPRLYRIPERKSLRVNCLVCWD
jgi:dihydroorotate dehydrogenase